MIFDITAIIERMCAATGSKNNSQLSAYLDRNPSVISGWKAKKTPPFEDCWKIHIETGVDFHWLITGKESGDTNVPDQKSVLTDDYLKIKNTFLGILGQGYQMGYISHTVKTTDENLQLMADMMYEELTGKVIAETTTKTDDEKAI